MKLIAFCGSHAVGKNDVANGVLEFFGEGVLERIVPCTTRPPRPSEVHGRDYYFVSEEEFARRHEAREFVFDVRIRDTQRSGTLRSELLSKERAIVDIVPEGARLMRDLLRKESQGDALLVFIYASEQERRRRIQVRDPSVTPEQVERMIRHDPVNPNPSLYCSDFDLLVSNPDGQLEQTVQTVVRAIRHFLRT